MKAWVEVLADPALKGRAAGSAEARRVAALLAGELAALGFAGAPGDGEMCWSFDEGKLTDQNVIAHFERSPGRAGAAGGGGSKRPIVIVGAHYDAQGTDGQGNVYPGADDNASGVAALLEIARLITQDERRTESDLLFIAFGAEERGALGAKAYVARPTAPLERAAVMINLDMVGRPFLDGLPLRAFLGKTDTTIGFLTSERDREALDARVRSVAREAGARVLGIPESIMEMTGFLSDSVVFSEHMPTIFFSTSGHVDYHRPTDTAEKIDYGQMERVVKLVLGLLRQPFAVRAGVGSRAEGAE